MDTSLWEHLWEDWQRCLHEPRMLNLRPYGKVTISSTRRDLLGRHRTGSKASMIEWAQHTERKKGLSGNGPQREIMGNGFTVADRKQTMELQLGFFSPRSMDHQRRETTLTERDNQNCSFEVHINKEGWWTSLGEHKQRLADIDMGAERPITTLQNRQGVLHLNSSLMGKF